MDGFARRQESTRIASALPWIGVGLAAAAAIGVGALALSRRAGRRRLTRAPANPSGHTPTGDRRVSGSVTIARTPWEVYEFWRDLRNLPRFTQHVERVTIIDDRRSHWTVRAPGGRTVEWDATITEDRPNEAIAWQTIGHPDVTNAGVVRFRPAPGDQGTEVHVTLHYRPLFGAVGVAIATLLGEEPGLQLRGDLRRLKQVLEIGEVMQSDASAQGPGLHAAQPPAARPPAAHPPLAEALA